jgi:hypothetical protein
MAGCGVSLADSEAAKGPRGRSAPIPVQVSSAGGSLQDGPSPTLTDCTPSGLSRFSSVFLPLASRADRYEIDSDAPSGNYRRSTRADRPASEKTPGRAPRTDCTASTGDRSMERHRIGASRTCPPSSSAKTRTCSRILRKPSFPPIRASRAPRNSGPSMENGRNKTCRPNDGRWPAVETNN